MKKIGYPILLLMIGFGGWPFAIAQPRTGYSDSLMAVLGHARKDTLKARLLMQLADYWADRDSAKAIGFANQAIPYTQERSLLRGISHFYLAGAYFNTDRIKSQEEYMLADEILRNFKTKEAFQYRSRAWHNYGVLEQMAGKDKRFVDILLTQAIPFARAAGDEERVAWNYTDLGNVFMNYKDYSRAGGYYEKAISILNNRKEYQTPVLAECYMSIAKSYILQDQPDKAPGLLKSAFNVLKSNPDSSFLSAYYQIEGMYYSRKKQWVQAIGSLDKGLAIASQLNRPYDAMSILYEKYEAYKIQGKLDKAKPLLEEVYAHQKDFPIANNERRLLYELAQAEAGLGNHKAAFDRLMQYTQVSDSFFKEQTAHEITDLEARYKVAEKEKQLLQLRHHNQLQRLFLYFGAGILALLGAFVVYMLKQRRKRERERLLMLNQEQAVHIARAQLEGEERERQRIARDLHDGLGGMLASVKLKLSAASHGSEGDQKGELESVIGQLDVSVDELRRIARNMMPEMLLRTGLTAALKDLCKRMSSDQMMVDCEILNVPENILLQEKVDIYRIVQELLTNAARHSMATEVFVQCSLREGRFYITVEDNGQGMPQGNLSVKGGMGLDNVRSRVTYMNGKTEIDSHPGKGTIINIEVNVTEER